MLTHITTAHEAFSSLYRSGLISQKWPDIKVTSVLASLFFMFFVYEQLLSPYW